MPADAERAVLKSMSVSDDRATITIGFRDIATEYSGKCRLGRSKAGVVITRCVYCRCAMLRCTRPVAKVKLHCEFIRRRLDTLECIQVH